jgi:gamma-glutamyl hydrolase
MGKFTQKKRAAPVRIGILSSPMPVTRLKQAASYVDHEYVEWVQLSGASAVVVPFNTDQLDQYLDSLHGMVFCGGAIENKKTHSAAQHDRYMEVFRTIFAYAVERQKAGNCFPLFGVCLGFQLLALMGADTRCNRPVDSLQNVAVHRTSPITFLGSASRMKRHFPAALRRQMQASACALHSHQYGFTLTDDLYVRHLAQYLTVVSVDQTDEGVDFVNLFEYKNCPFYGCQWHVERTFNDLSAQVARQMSLFFKKECSKATQRANLWVRHRSLSSKESVLMK